MEEQEIDIISREVTAFRAGWLNLQVTTDGLQIMTFDAEEFYRLRDLAIGILNTLRHTPISVMGINREVHLSVSDKEQWHAVGDALVPKDIWKKEMTVPGMRNVTVWDARPDEHSGHVQVQVEPSARIPQAIYIACNDHYNLAPASRTPSRDVAWDLSEEILSSSKKIPISVSILTDDWIEVTKRADSYLSIVKALAEASE